MPDDDDLDRLPSTPPEVLDLLRRVEANLAESEALREQVAALRAELEVEHPLADRVGAVMLRGEGTLSASGEVTSATTIAAAGTVEVVSNTYGSADVIHASDHVEAEIETAETTRMRQWAGTLARRGPGLIRVADLVVRLWDRFDPPM